jgi:Arm DNA-binding domain
VVGFTFSNTVETIVRVTIGRHGVDVTAEQARQEAMRLRGIIAAGEDPIPDADEKEAALTH